MSREIRCWDEHVFLKFRRHADSTLVNFQNDPSLYLAPPIHYNGIIMSAMASRITSLAIVYLSACSGADQRKHQSSASLAFVRGIHRWPVNSPHKGPVTRKVFPFDDVIIFREIWWCKVVSLHEPRPNIRLHNRTDMLHYVTMYKRGHAFLKPKL